MLSCDNFKIIIRDYQIQEIYVDDCLVDMEKLKGTKLWDIVNNVDTWMTNYKVVWSHKYNKEFTIYPYRLMPKDIDMDRNSYNTYVELVRREMNGGDKD